jgi:hypothetical protein
MRCNYDEVANVSNVDSSSYSSLLIAPIDLVTATTRLGSIRTNNGHVLKGIVKNRIRFQRKTNVSL